MLKRFAALLLALFLLPGVPAALAHEPYVVTYADTEGEESIAGYTAQYFAEAVLEITGEGIEVELHFDGELGDFDACLSDLRKKGETVSFMRVPVSVLSALGCEKLSLLSLPGAFADHDQFARLAESGLVNDLFNEPNGKKLGLLGVGFWEGGYVHTAFREAAADLSAYQGKTVAFSGTPAMEDVLRALGAAPAAMPGDVRAALRSGAVDGAETTLETYWNSALYEDAGHLLMDAHRMDVSLLAVSAEAWRLLTNLERRCILLAAQMTAQYNAQLVREFEENVSAMLREKGVTLTEADRAACLSAAKEAVDRAAGRESGWFEKLKAQ